MVKVPFIANQQFTNLRVKDDLKDLVDIKFLFYYCYKLDAWCLANTNQGNFASVDMKRFSNFIFAIPSLEKQREIIRRLEQFDALCHDLTAGLPAEIEGRQRQYEYYRDKLLSFTEKGSQ